MSVHALDLLDLPTLYRYRSEAVSLDCTRLLTRGNPLGAIGAMAYMNPRRHIYSAVCRNDGATLVGGISHVNGDDFAKLLYLAPASQLENPSLPGLIENLTVQAGGWGALHVLAEVEDDSPAFVPLRRAGLFVYEWQRTWDVTALIAALDAKDGTDGSAVNKWRRAGSGDQLILQNLYHQIVPPLLQPVEPAPKAPGGFIWDDGVLSYVGVITGMLGIVLFPLMHPEVTDVGAKLGALIHTLPNRGGRPVYVIMRSYQAWLEPVLHDMGARPSGRQAVMVKHLAHLVKEEQTVRAKQPANVSVPASGITRIESKK